MESYFFAWQYHKAFDKFDTIGCDFKLDLRAAHLTMPADARFFATEEARKEAIAPA